MSVTIKFRRGNSAEWTSNGSTVLASGEPGYELDTGRFKIGNGITAWSGLYYASIVPTGFVSGSGISINLSPNGSSATISVSGLNASGIVGIEELIDDRIGTGLFVAGTGIDLLYNDSGNIFTVSVSGLINNPSNNRILTSRDNTTTGIDAENNATFDGATLAISGAITVDNLRLDGNTLSSTNSNGNIIIQPSGVGALQRDGGGDARGQYSVDWQTVRASGSQVAGGNYSVICGGSFNASSGNYSITIGGKGNVANAAGSFIGGGGTDDVGNDLPNMINGTLGVVVGGYGNTVDGFAGFIGAGRVNTAVGPLSVIGGGEINTTLAGGIYSVIAGGASNTTSASYTTIAGGSFNVVSGDYSAILGGQNNNAIHNNTFVLGSNITTTQTDTTYTQNLISQSGRFTALTVNNTGVSLSGHTHVSTDITDFNSAVSGLFPVKNIVAGTGISVSSVSGIYTITSTGSGVIADQASSVVTTVFNKTGSPIPKMSAVYINGGQGDQPTIQLAIATGDATSAGTYGVTYEAISNMSLGKVVVIGALTGVNTDPAHGGIAGATAGSVLYLSPTTSGLLTTTKPSAPNHIVTIGNVVRVHQNEGVIEVRIVNGFELEELHNVAISGATNGQFLQYNSSSGLWVPSSSGNFTTLQLNGTTVSVVGHTHTASEITDFNEAVDDRIGSGLFVAGTGISLSYSDAGNSFTVSVTGLINNPTNNRILTSRDNTTTGIDAESNLTFDGSKLGINTVSPSGALDVAGDAYIRNSTNTVGNLYFKSSTANSETSCKIRTDTFGNLYLDAGPYVKVGNQDGTAQVIAGNAPVTIGHNASSSTNQNIIFTPRSIERVRIASDGKVGIGISSPSGELHVVGTGIFTSVSGSLLNIDNIRIDGNTITSTNSNGNIIIQPSGNGALQRDSGGNTRGVYAIDWQTERVFDYQIASGSYSVIGGGSFNQAAGQSNVIGGGSSNFTTGLESVIAGGNTNKASGDYTTVCGGSSNSNYGNSSFIGGGSNNIIVSGSLISTIAGGYYNSVSGSGSIVCGGLYNNITKNIGIIVGGSGNTVSGFKSAILGGTNNNDNGYSNVFILGSNLSATQADTTYTENLIAQSGKFTNLTVNNTGVSLVGHTHTVSDITNFNSSVSGLLPSNIVTGTGVVNHVAYWNSSSGIVADSGQLFWDSTNNRLGIGTETPASQLQVVGTGRFTNIDINNSAIAGSSALTVNGSISTQSQSIIAGQFAMYGDGNTILHKANASTFAMSVSNSGYKHSFGWNSLGTHIPWATITSSGVGIGTSSPSYQLHVIGTGNFSGLTVDTSGNVNLQNVLIIDSDNFLAIYGQNSASLDTEDNSIYKWGLLDCTIQNSVIGNVVPSSGYFTNLFVNNSGVPVGSGAANHVAYWSSNSALTHDSGQLYWDATNNRLGIGTSSPGYSLDVVGNAEFGANGSVKLIDTGGGNARMVFTNAGSVDCGTYFTFRNNAGTVEYARIDTAGRVGIGTNSPTYKLDVVGTGNFSQNLLVNGTGVSISGHTHTSSDITNFNASVSGLLPTISNSGDNRILTSTGSSTGINAESNATFDGTTFAVSGAITVDNLKLDGNTLSSTNSNGNIIIQPSGTGALQRDGGGDARGQYAVDWQTVRASGSQVAGGNYSVIGGGQTNTASNSYSTVGGGNTNAASGNRSTISGGSNNTSSNYASTVGGGQSNIASETYSTVGGGSANSATGIYSTIGGGVSNTASGSRSTVCGGYTNTASGRSSTISGGDNNTASGTYSNGYGTFGHQFVGGGKSNDVTAYFGTIGGGEDNTVSGYINEQYAPPDGHGTIAGGKTNTVNGIYGFIGGGQNNTVSANYNGGSNYGHGTIGGGKNNTISTYGYYGTVGGGQSNTASASCSTVGGGLINTASGGISTVGGGQSNTASGSLSKVGGGYNNTASNSFSTVGGGKTNTASATYSTVGGGYSNTASNSFSTVGGGYGNTASGGISTVGGGFSNTASASRSTVGGGLSNTASGAYSTVPGGMRAKATRYGELSHAAGYFASIGDAQHTILVARRTTTNATANQVLFLDNSSSRLTLPAKTTWTFSIKLSAYNDTDNEGGWWIFRGGIRRNAANGTALIGSLITESGVESSLSTASASVVADDTNEALEIRVTGVTGKNIRWVAVIDISQVSYGTP